MPSRDKDADAPPGGVRVHASLPAPDRRGRIATIISFLLHALVILLAIRLTAAVTLPEHSPIGDAIQIALGGGGGGGQRGAAPLHPVAPQVTKPVVPPPPPVPTVIPPPPAPQQPVPPPAAVADPSAAGAVAAAGTGTGSGGGAGSGAGTGTGSGQGPGTGSGSGGGTGNAGSPPVNKQMIVPGLDWPKKLKGKTVDVTFFVAADGHVTNLSVTPPIDDRAYAKKFDEIMRDFRFTPARDSAGKAIAGVTTVSVTF